MVLRVMEPSVNGITESLHIGPLLSFCKDLAGAPWTRTATLAEQLRPLQWQGCPTGRGQGWCVWTQANKDGHMRMMQSMCHTSFSGLPGNPAFKDSENYLP